MRYNYRQGVTHDKKRPTWIIWILLLLAILAAAYYAANIFAPQLISMPLSDKNTADATMQKMRSAGPSDEPHLYVPQINIDLPIDLSGDRPQSTAIRQQGNKINPDQDGALAICAPRFVLGATPWQTRARSPFYNLAKLQNDDEFYVDYHGARYAYKVQNIQPGAAEVKNDAKQKGKSIVLYACDQQGQDEQFVTIQADQTGKVASEKSKEDTQN